MADEIPRGGDVAIWRKVKSELVAEVLSLRREIATHDAALREAEARGYKRAIEDAARIAQEHEDEANNNLLLGNPTEASFHFWIEQEATKIEREIRALAEQPQSEQEVMPYSAPTTPEHNAQPPSVEGGGEMPPMVPSAKDRARKAIEDYPIYHSEMDHAVSASIPAIIQAYRDGWNSGDTRADRIIAALVNPDDDFVLAVCAAMSIAPSGKIDEARAALYAAAEYLRENTK